MTTVLLATIMVGLTAAIHGLGLSALQAALRARRWRPGGLEAHAPWWTRALGALQATPVVVALFVLHAIQIMLYAALYLAVGALETWEEALYFSSSTFTTVGFGDVVLDEQWRLLAAIESANGFLLIGWSTAFLVAILEITGPQEKD